VYANLDHFSHQFAGLSNREMKLPRFTAADRRVALAIALYVLLLATLPLLLSEPAFDWTFLKMGHSSGCLSLHGCSPHCWP
jgi:hypothetical protein